MLKPWVIAVAAVGLAACGREHQTAEPAPAAATGPAFDVGRATRDPAALLAAASRPPRELLPSFRLKATSRVVVSGAGEPPVSDVLDEEALVERAPGGELHAYYGNSREHGRELYSAGGTVWVRPRYGKFHKRPPAEPREAERAADEIGGTLAADLALVLPGAGLTGGEAVTVAGRPGHKVTLARTAMRPRPEEKGWRATAVVDALDGELVLDDATGAVLSGRLAAQVSFTRGENKLSMTLAATHALSDVGGPVAVAVPADADSAPTPGRSTEVDDREELLGGLAPSTRRPRAQP